MILTEEQAKARVESGNNLLNRFGRKEEKANVEVIPITRQRDGKKESLTEEAKIEVAARARTGERHKDLAEEFQVSRQTVMYLDHGGEGGRGFTDSKKVEARMDEIQDKALCKLMMSIGLLDEERLGKLGAKDLSTVAANMAKVAGNVRPSVNDGNAVHLHLYAPELRKEQNYKTIEVSSL